MQLESLTPAETIRIPLDHPQLRGDGGAGVPLDGVAFVLAGPYSQRARTYFIERADQIDEGGKRKKFSDHLADQRAAVRDLLVAVEGLEVGGVPLTPAAITDDLANTVPLSWLLEQAFVKFSKASDFFGERKTDSSPTPDISASSPG